MKTFDDLIFEEHSLTKGLSTLPFGDCIGAKQAKITFSNGVKLSVVFGKVFYSNGVDTYEAWASSVDNEPRGYLTKEEVSEYMKKLQKN